MAEHDALPPDGALPPEFQVALDRSVEFLNDVLPHLGRLYGLDVNVHVAQLPPDGAGLAADAETGDFLFDPRFFLERGYTADEAVYGGCHEFSAHITRVLREPEATRRVNAFAQQGKPQAMFRVLLEDTAGNKLTHAMLPQMKKVGEGLYRDKLFEEQDYTDLPRHVQFLYKILRDEMVPDETALVVPEVEEALASLRDFQGQGDLIKYATDPSKSAHKLMTAEEQFKIWHGIIYPVYEGLLEQDREDPRFQPDPNQQGQEGDGQPGDGNQPQEGQQNGEGQPSNQSQPGQPGEQGGQQPAQPGENQGQPSGGQPNQQPSEGTPQQSDDQQRFGSYYRDYHENRHPEAMTDEEAEKVQKQAEARAAERRQQQRNPMAEHERQLNAKLREETGHSLAEQRQYDAEVVKHQAAIEEMREVFRAVINERIAQRRGLSRRNFAEGAVLDPDRLVQTVIDVHNRVPDPEAFRDYEQRRGETRAIGKTDYIFLFDRSQSMQEDGKAVAAASTAVVGLEGLAALQRDVEEAEATHKIELDLDIRTAIYSFGMEVQCLKPLSTKISPKERLDGFAALRGANEGATRDFLAVEALEEIPREPGRKRIVIVVSDGETYDPVGGATSARTRRAVERARGEGDFVYGISIGSDAAEQLYSPTSRRIDDPAKLPEAIQSFLEATIS